MDRLTLTASFGLAAAYFAWCRYGSLPSNALPHPRILLFGDSITQGSFSVGGWGARLQDRYQRRADVINRGFSGYNTRWALRLLGGPQLRDGPGVRTVLTTVFFGANDASLLAHNPRHHVPLDEFATNLRTIVSHLREHCPDSAVLLISPPPVCHEQRLAYQRQRYPDSPSGVLERTNENAGVYAAEVVRVAQELGLPCVNLWEAMQAAAPDGRWHSYLSDGLHLSPAGNDKAAELILAAVETAFPALAVTPDPHTGALGNSATKSALAQNFPFHDEIDYKDPAAAFASYANH